jgi:hypothetical protein
MFTGLIWLSTGYRDGSTMKGEKILNRLGLLASVNLVES